MWVARVRTNATPQSTSTCEEIPLEIIQQFGVQIADTNEKIDRARILLSDMFGRRGYLVNHPNENRPGCLTFLSSNDKQICGTISICSDSLPAYEIFTREVSELQINGAKLCEICRLAFVPTMNFKSIFAALVHIVFLHAKYRYHGTHAIIQVNPRHEGYYSKMLGFQAVSDVRTNHHVNAPARLLWLDFDEMQKRIDVSLHALTKRDRSLYPYFFSRDVADGILARIMQE